MKKLLLTTIILLSSLCLFAYDAKDVEGHWYLAAKTPIGIKYGYLDCDFTSHSQFCGIINIFKHDNKIENGVFDGNAFSFTGKIKFVWSNIAYEASGRILREDSVVADIDAKGIKMKAVASRSEDGLKKLLEEVGL